jgi:hypothetical protein
VPSRVGQALDDFIMRVNFEITNSENGEPQHPFKEVGDFECSDDASIYAIVRRAKQVIGWNGKRIMTTQYDECVEIRPFGVDLVARITFKR